MTAAPTAFTLSNKSDMTVINKCASGVCKAEQKYCHTLDGKCYSKTKNNIPWGYETKFKKLYKDKRLGLLAYDEKNLLFGASDSIKLNQNFKSVNTDKLSTVVYFTSIAKQEIEQELDRIWKRKIKESGGTRKRSR